MQVSEQPVLRDLVLVGGGHSHVVVLRMLAMQPEPGLRTTLICTDVDTPYSGMLPGYISGHYSFDDVHIDLGRLAAFAKARFIRAEVTGLDRANQRVMLRGRPSVPYDLLSINTGSTPKVRQVDGAQAHTVPVKPIAHFNQRWLQLLERVRELHSRFTIAVVPVARGAWSWCCRCSSGCATSCNNSAATPTCCASCCSPRATPSCRRTTPGCARALPAC
jgi:selenide,water dikinase